MSAVKTAKRIGWRSVNDSAVLFNCQTQEIRILNETGTATWESLAEGQSLDECAALLCEEFGAEAGDARVDTYEFVSELQSAGFLDGDPHFAVNEGAKTGEQEGENVLLELEMMAIESMTPFAVTFEVTYSCNEHCIHCYMERGKRALPLARIKSILDELAERGCLFVSFTGGEFFMRKDALEIIEYAAKKRFVIDILSNAALVTPAIAKRLASYPVRRVQVSLYGSNASTHDRVTRVPGSFDNTIQGIKSLRNAGVKVEIALPLMSVNFDERYQVRDLAYSLDCYLSPSPIISARNDGSEDTFDLRLTDEQLHQFYSDKEFSGLYAGRSPFADHQLYLGFEDLTQAPPCYSGINTAAINPQGIVYPCNQFLQSVGDLKVNSFGQIWDYSDELNLIRRIKIGDLPTCGQCEMLHACTRCPGLALLEGGNVLGPSPENCRITKIIVPIGFGGGE